MEIQKASSQTIQSDTGPGLGGTIANSKSIEQSIAVENAVAGQMVNLSADYMSKALTEKGEEDALVDAAKDQKTKDSYNILRDQEKQQKSDLAQIGKKRELAASLGEDTTELDKQFETATSNIASTNSDKRNMQDDINKNLDMKSSTWTKYGKAYKQKAQAIGLNRVLIDLDKTSQELAVEFKDDPIGYAAEMQEYANTVKEQLPENMHEAYDQKMRISKNGYEQKIYENVSKQQNDELAAVTKEKMDLTRINMLNAASNGDTQAGRELYKTSKEEYKTQLKSLVKNGIVSADYAVKLYQQADIEATQQLIMSSFSKKLAENPKAAMDFAVEFAKNTSQQQYGTTQERRDELKSKKQKKPKDDRKNTLDLEYDSIERDKMSSLMFAQIKSEKARLSAKNSSDKSANNSFLDQAISVLKTGKNFVDKDGVLAGLNGSNANEEKIKEFEYYSKNWANVANFKADNVINMENKLTELKSNKDSGLYDQDLIKLYEEVLATKKAGLAKDPAAELPSAYNMEDIPSFSPLNIKAFTEGILPLVESQGLESGAKLNLLTNTQLDIYTKYWKDLGSMDKIQVINTMGSGKEATLLFEQMGTDAHTLYKIIQSRGPNSVGTAQSIVLGLEKIENGIKPYKENDIKEYMNLNANGREKYKSGKEIKGAREAIVGYAVQNNPDIAELTEDHIKEAMDAVYGKTGDLGGEDIDGSGGWASFDDTINDHMIIYEKNVDEVETYIENIQPDQITKTIPDGAKFYADGELTPETLIQDMQLGKVQFKGTGISGEYILVRGNVPIVLIVPGTAEKDGKTHGSLREYKFKLWENN